MKVIKVFVSLFFLLILQVALFAHLRPFGVAPDLLLVAAVVGAIVGGPEFGVRNGFAAGLLLDLVVPGPLGLAAGLYGAVAYMTGQVSRTVDSDDPRIMPLIIFLASGVATVAYGFGLGVLGSEQFVEWGLFTTAFAVAVYAVPLAFAVRRLYSWVLVDPTQAARTEPARSVVN